MSNTNNPTVGTNMDATQFSLEQAHLEDTYNTLKRLASTTAAKIQRNNAEAAQEKEDMASEIAPNFATSSDAFETYSEYAGANSLISAYNLAQDANIDKLKKLNALLDEPYFAKLVLEYKANEPAKELYLGVAGATDENYKRIVVDWRSPVAEVYYNQSTGQTSYAANGKTINVNLKLRRQFSLSKNVLHSYFDTNIAIQDELLLSSLSANRSDHMQHITATIQAEQNEVIRHKDVEALLVTGVAGSGKTSVLLQRLAYLFYLDRNKLAPEEVFLISPNKVFSKYIEQVLPSLGEANPETLTWDEFAKAQLPFGRSLKTTLGSIDLFKAVDKAMACFNFEDADIKDISIQGVCLISAAQIKRLILKYSHIPAGPHLVTLVREDLFERLKAKLAQLAATEVIQNEILLLPLNEQVGLFSGPYDPQNDDEAKELALIYLNKRFEAALSSIENDEWLRIDRIGMRLLGIENLPATLWMYVKCAVTGACNTQAKYLIIDEVQDYTIDQIALLKKYYRKAHFMLMGDPYQAISEQSLEFSELATLFEEAEGGLYNCTLATSYRSTPSITKLFSTLLPESAKSVIQTVQREDEEPIICPFSNHSSYEDTLRKRITKAQNDDGLTAIIVPWKQGLKRIKTLMKDSCPATMDGTRMLPNKGAVVLTLAQAKGLEFDTVIVPNASAEIFKDDTLSRNRLYTTCSRANKRLEIYSDGPLTPLLNMSFDQ